jgi:hypothetical protein
MPLRSRPTVRVCTRRGTVRDMLPLFFFGYSSVESPFVTPTTPFSIILFLLYF